MNNRGKIQLRRRSEKRTDERAEERGEGNRRKKSHEGRPNLRPRENKHRLCDIARGNLENIISRFYSVAWPPPSLPPRNPTGLTFSREQESARCMRTWLGLLNSSKSDFEWIPAKERDEISRKSNKIPQNPRYPPDSHRPRPPPRSCGNSIQRAIVPRLIISPLHCRDLHSAISRSACDRRNANKLLRFHRFWMSSRHQCLVYIVLESVECIHTSILGNGFTSS